MWRGVGDCVWFVWRIEHREIFCPKGPLQNISVLRRARFLPYGLAEQSGMQGIEFVQALGQRLWVFFIHNMAGMFDKL